jgi:hypothetical protein
MKGKKKRTGKSQTTKAKQQPKADTPYWQKNAGKKGPAPDRSQSQPHSVGKRFWRM